MAEMSKTPEEIKKGLECFSNNWIGIREGSCGDCKYLETEGGSDATKCCHWGLIIIDAIDCIQRLEVDNAKKDETIKMLQDGNASLMNMIDEECEKTVRLERERDAALADFKLYRERNIKQECGVYACDLCKHGGKYEELEKIKCPEGCMGIKNWEWRGVPEKEEEHEVDSD